MNIKEKFVSNAIKKKNYSFKKILQFRMRILIFPRIIIIHLVLNRNNFKTKLMIISF